MDYLFVDCVKWLLSCPFVIITVYGVAMGLSITVAVLTVVRRGIF